MFQAILRRRAFAVAALLAISLSTNTNASDIRYKPASREVIQSRVAQYNGNNKQREATLKRLFEESGCDSRHISEQQVKGSKLPNLICFLPGRSGSVIIVGAHYDKADEGDGVVDNWSGASLLPSLYEALKIEPRQHSYVFIGFTDEERGEIGSQFYVQKMTADQIAATDAMVNMDTLGLAPTEVWASHSDKRLVEALAFVAKQLNLPITAMNVENVGSTDSEQFSKLKIPSITVHSLTQESWDAHILHTSKDNLSAVRLEYYYQTYRLLAAYLTFLDHIEPITSRSDAH